MSGHRTGPDARPCRLLRLGAGLTVALLAVAGALAPARGNGPVQHGAQPNPEEVRPGSPEGDRPSATAGEHVRPEEARRVLGLPVNAVLILAGVLLALLVVAGVLLPRTRHGGRARGNGTYRSRAP
jgi:hypothetical protein